MATPVNPRDNAMRAAIVNSLFGQIKQPPFSCPGQKCYFPSFTSLGVCNACRDVTSQVGKSRASTTGSPIQSWMITTPGNLTLEASSSFDAHRGFVHTLVNSTTAEYQTEQLPISAAFVRFPEDEISARPSDRWIEELQAYECSIYLCGQSYEGWTMVNGTLQPGTVRTSNLTKTSDQSEVTEWEVSDDNFPEKVTFRMNYLDNSNMFQLLSDVLFDLHSRNGLSSASEVALHNAESIPAVLDNIATSMSYRMLSGPNSTTLEDIVYSFQTMIFVQWAWLPLPIALYLLACGFLAAVVLASRRAGHLIWKSSLMPLLLTDDSYPMQSATDKTGVPATQNLGRKTTIINQLVNPRRS